MYHGLVQLKRCRIFGKLEGFYLCWPGDKLLVLPVVKRLVPIGLGCLVGPQPGSVSVGLGLGIVQLELGFFAVVGSLVVMVGS